MGKAKQNAHRIKMCQGLIRQVRGKPLLEALYRLQDGRCAYDGQPCVLLLPQAVDLSSSRRALLEQRPRFATIDHVVPRASGGGNVFPNLVMAAQIRNNEKGCLAPSGRWTPERRHSEKEIVEALKLVEHTRLMLAQKLAADRKLNRQQIIEKLIARELRRTPSRRDFKFYEEQLRVVV